MTVCSSINQTIPPVLFPFYDDKLKLSRCDELGNSQTVELAQVAAMLSRETPEDRWYQPVGLIIHVARVGSTVVANMVGAHPDVVV